MLDPAQPLTLTVASSDNSGVYTLDLAVSGDLSATQHVAIAAAPNAPSTNLFAIPLTGAVLDGRGLTVTVKAVDGALNASQVIWNFGLPDRKPPFLTGIAPANGAQRQPIWLGQIALQFNKPIATNSVSTNSIIFTNSLGSAGAYQVAVAADPSTVLILPASLPLKPGLTYTCRALPLITDLAGNHLAADTNGTPLPADGLASTFTTAAILGTTPANGTRFVAGQHVAVGLQYEPGLGAAFFRVQWSTNPPATVPAGVTNATAVIQLPTNAVSGALHLWASADSTFAQALSLPDITLNVSPYGSDAPPIAGLPITLPTLAFNGTNDYADAAYSAGSLLFNLSSQFTYELWVNPDSAGPLIERQQCNSAWASAELALEGDSTTNLSISLNLNYANGDSYTTFTTLALVPLDRWSHIAATYDHNAQSVNIYLDGSNVLTGSYSQTLWLPPTPLWIGGVPKPSGGCWESYFEGSIREVAVWNSARNQNDIQNDMDLGLAGKEPNLVG